MRVTYYNRYSQKIEDERIYGDFFVRLLYARTWGQPLAWLLSLAWFSKLYGWLQNQPWSRRKIKPFQQEFAIAMNQFEEPERGYQNFNEFFIRPFKPGQRSFPEQEQKMGALAEGRYFGFESVSDLQQFPVKGVQVNLEELLRNHQLASVFHNGPLLIARLCPVDYHRFHFPAAGKVIESYEVQGKLHSVNPLALKAKDHIYLENHRQITVMESPNWGKLAMIEVGALCVGKIVQTFQKTAVKAGDEKGYFLFGGSTVLLLGETGRWSPSEDILQQTAQQREVFVQLGDQVALS